MTKIWIVTTNYGCMDRYFETKEKALKFIIDDNLEQDGRTDSLAREVELE